MEIVDKRQPPTITFEQWCDREKLHVELVNSAYVKDSILAVLRSNDSDLMVIESYFEFAGEVYGTGKTSEEAIKDLIRRIYGCTLHREDVDKWFFARVGPHFKVPTFKDES